MSDKKIDEQDLSKALNVLQDLAKGHSSRGTAATAVESMSGEGGSTQVHHTASNSDPGGWAGSGSRPASENGATDAIEENGTDYSGGAEVVKSILAKLSKGQPLTAEEFAMVKGMPAFLKKDDDKKDDKKDDDVDKAMDDKEDDVKKSLADEAAANDTLSKGLEISDFLAEFVGVFSKSLSAMEARIEARDDRMRNALQSEASRNEEFGKSLASALGTLSEGLIATTQRVDQVESTPAYGPKSQQMAKGSFDGPEGATLTKSQIAGTLIDMVQNNKIAATDVIRFDSTGDISDETYAKVLSHRSGK